MGNEISADTIEISQFEDHQDLLIYILDNPDVLLQVKSGESYVPVGLNLGSLEAERYENTISKLIENITGLSHRHKANILVIPIINGFKDGRPISADEILNLRTSLIVAINHNQLSQLDKEVIVFLPKSMEVVFEDAMFKKRLSSPGLKVKFVTFKELRNL